jgi:hypothetical protein
MEPPHEADEGVARVLDALTTARDRDRAPDSVRLRIEQGRRAADRQGRRRGVLTAAGAGALVVLAAVLAIVLTGGGAQPSVAQAAQLAARGPAGPAPAAAPDRRGRLDQSVGDIYFPNLQQTFGWTAIGQRADRLSGHQALTVYYLHGNQDVAYTILSAPALPAPSGATLRAGSLTVRELRVGSRTVVTWRRGQVTCVLSAQGVGARQLARLASWTA